MEKASGVLSKGKSCRGWATSFFKPKYAIIQYSFLELASKIHTHFQTKTAKENISFGAAQSYIAYRREFRFHWCKANKSTGITSPPILFVVTNADNAHPILNTIYFQKGYEGFEGYEGYGN